MAAAIMALPATARGQYDGTVWRLPAGGSAGAAASSRGVQQSRPQPQPVIVVQPVAQRTVFHRRSTLTPQTSVVPQRSAIIWVPAVVLADGRVFANFGYGFEQVFRSCAAGPASGGGVVVGQPSVIAGNGTVLAPQVPTYTQPVPNQQTASQQMASQQMAAANVGQSVMVAPAYTTCFSQTAAGGVIVYRF